MGVRRIDTLSYREAKELLKDEKYNFKYVVGWSGFDAFGEYYVDIEKKLCLYMHFNERAGTDNSALYEFDDLAELANWIWEEEKGTVPFREIAEGIKRVSGVDVAMSASNKVIKMLFGEASD